MYKTGSYKTEITGVMHLSGKNPNDIAQAIGDRMHGYYPNILSREDLYNLGLFISSGLHNTDLYISDGKGLGDEKRGSQVFQTVCAAYHGYEGTELNWSDDNDPAYVGTEANANPWEVLHKIRNGPIRNMR